ncbi:helix-turn-helix domain-containing protein [Bacillus paranthracis]
MITRSYLSQIEKGLIQPSYEVLEALSNKLNCSVEDFFDVVENKELTLSQIKKDIKAAETTLQQIYGIKLRTLLSKRTILITQM